MITYKLFRYIDDGLYPLYVEADKKMPLQVWLDAGCGELVDATHVKAKGCGGKLSLRPGFHSTSIPFTDWIGAKQPDGRLFQRKNTVWCECFVKGEQIEVTNRYGLRTIPDGWYYFKTNAKQKEPWVISNKLYINCKILSNNEVAEICKSKGIKPQPVEQNI